MPTCDAGGGGGGAAGETLHCQKLRRQRLQRPQQPQQLPLGVGGGAKLRRQRPGGIQRRKRPLQRQLLNNQPTNKSVQPVAVAVGVGAAAVDGRDGRRRDHRPMKTTLG